jgi:hypothetical protein
MGRTCTICGHGESHQINVALVHREPYRHIAAQWNVSTGALQRHSKEHIPELLRKASEAEEIMQADSLLQKIEELRLKAMDVLEQAEATQEHGLVLAAIDRASNQLKLLAQAMGGLHENQVNVAVQVPLLEHPGYARLSQAILGALEKYPEARWAVAGALREIE